MWESDIGYLMFLRHHPTVEFYRYTHFCRTNGYLAYHIEDDNIFEFNGSEMDSVNYDTFDCQYPFFIFHGKDTSCFDSPFPIYEIEFEVKPNEIYVVQDEQEYYSLTYVEMTKGGYDTPRFTTKADRLIEKGKRWFILPEAIEGEVQSFLVNPSSLISRTVPYLNAD